MTIKSKNQIFSIKFLKVVLLTLIQKKNFLSNLSLFHFICMIEKKVIEDILHDIAELGGGNGDHTTGHQEANTRKSSSWFPINIVRVEKLSKTKMEHQIQFIKEFMNQFNKMLFDTIDDERVMVLIDEFGRQTLMEALATVVFHDKTGCYRDTTQKAPKLLHIAVRNKLPRFLHFLLTSGGGTHASVPNLIGDNIFHLIAWADDVVAFDMITSVCDTLEIDLNVMNHSGTTPFELACRFNHYQIIDRMLCTECIQAAPLLKDMLGQILKGSKVHALTLGYCLKYYGHEILHYIDAIEDIPSWASEIIYGYRFLIRNRDKVLLEAWETLNKKH